MTEGNDPTKPALPTAKPALPQEPEPAMAPSAASPGVLANETPAATPTETRASPEPAAAPTAAAAKPAPPVILPAVKKAAPVPPGPQIPKNPGGAARLAKAATMVADKEQPPLAGNADLGWWVLNGGMTIGLIALAAITLYSCINIARAIIQIF